MYKRILKSQILLMIFLIVLSAFDGTSKIVISTSYGSHIAHAAGQTVDNSINIQQLPVTKEDLDHLNPLNIGGNEDITTIAPSEKTSLFSTPGSIISETLAFFFPLTGLILFFYIVWGGFQIVLGSADKKNVDEGKKRISSAIVGFLLLFSAYWVAKIVETVFNLKFL